MISQFYWLRIILLLATVVEVNAPHTYAEVHRQWLNVTCYGHRHGTTLTAATLCCYSTDPACRRTSESQYVIVGLPEPVVRAASKDLKDSCKCTAHSVIDTFNASMDFNNIIFAGTGFNSVNHSNDGKCYAINTAALLATLTIGALISFMAVAVVILLCPFFLMAQHNALRRKGKSVIRKWRKHIRLVTMRMRPPYVGRCGSVYKTFKPMLSGVSARTCGLISCWADASCLPKATKLPNFIRLDHNREALKVNKPSCTSLAPANAGDPHAWLPQCSKLSQQSQQHSSSRRQSSTSAPTTAYGQTPEELLIAQKNRCFVSEILPRIHKCNQQQLIQVMKLRKRAVTMRLLAKRRVHRLEQERIRLSLLLPDTDTAPSPHVEIAIIARPRRKNGPQNQKTSANQSSGRTARATSLEVRQRKPSACLNVTPYAEYKARQVNKTTTWSKHNSTSLHWPTLSDIQDAIICCHAPDKHAHLRPYLPHIIGRGRRYSSDPSPFAQRASITTEFHPPTTQIRQGKCTLEGSRTLIASHLRIMQCPDRIVPHRESASNAGPDSYLIIGLGRAYSSDPSPYAHKWTSLTAMAVQEQQCQISEGPITRVLDNVFFRAKNNEIQVIITQGAAHVLDSLMATTTGSVSDAARTPHVALFQTQSLPIAPSSHCDSIGSSIMQAVNQSLCVFPTSKTSMSATISQLEYFMPSTITYRAAMRVFFQAPVSVGHKTNWMTMLRTFLLPSSWVDAVNTPPIQQISGPQESRMHTVMAIIGRSVRKSLQLTSNGWPLFSVGSDLTLHPQEGTYWPDTTFAIMPLGTGSMFWPPASKKDVIGWPFNFNAATAKCIMRYGGPGSLSSVHNFPTASEMFPDWDAKWPTTAGWRDQTFAFTSVDDILPATDELTISKTKLSPAVVNLVMMDPYYSDAQSLVIQVATIDTQKTLFVTIGYPSRKQLYVATQALGIEIVSAGCGVPSTTWTPKKKPQEIVRHKFLSVVEREPFLPFIQLIQKDYPLAFPVDTDAMHDICRTSTAASSSVLPALEARPPQRAAIAPSQDNPGSTLAVMRKAVAEAFDTDKFPHRLAQFQAGRQLKWIFDESPFAQPDTDDSRTRLHSPYTLDAAEPLHSFSMSTMNEQFKDCFGAAAAQIPTDTQLILLQVNGWPVPSGQAKPTVKFDCSAELVPSGEWTTGHINVVIEYSEQLEPLTAILSAIQWMIQSLHGKFLIIHSGHIRLPEFGITHYLNLLQTSRAKFLIWDKPLRGHSALNELLAHMPIIGVSPTAAEHLTPTTINLDSVSKQLSSLSLSPSDFPGSNGFTSHELLFLQYAGLLQGSAATCGSSATSAFEAVFRIIPAILTPALSKGYHKFSVIAVLQGMASAMALLYKLLTFTFLPLIILPAADIMSTTFSRHVTPSCTVIRTFIVYSAGGLTKHRVSQHNAITNTIITWLFRLNTLRQIDGNQASIPELAKENIPCASMTIEEWSRILGYCSLHTHIPATDQIRTSLERITTFLYELADSTTESALSCLSWTYLRQRWQIEWMDAEATKDLVATINAIFGAAATNPAPFQHAYHVAKLHVVARLSRPHTSHMHRLSETLYMSGQEQQRIRAFTHLPLGSARGTKRIIIPIPPPDGTVGVTFPIIPMQEGSPQQIKSNWHTPLCAAETIPAAAGSCLLMTDHTTMGTSDDRPAPSQCIPVFAVIAELLPIEQCSQKATHGTFTDRLYFLPFSHHRQKGTTQELPNLVASETLALRDRQSSVPSIMDNESTVAVPANILPSCQRPQWIWLPNLPFRAAIRINYQALAAPPLQHQQQRQPQAMQDTEEDCPTTTVLIHLPGLFADTPDGIPELTRSAPVEVWIGSAQYGHSLRPIDTTINRSYVPTSIVSMSNAEAITAQLSTVSLVADEPRAMHEAAGDEGAISLLAARLHQLVRELCPTLPTYCIYSFSAGTKMAGALHHMLKLHHAVEVRSVLISPAMSVHDWSIIADLCSNSSEVAIVSHAEDQLCALNIAELPPALRHSCINVKLASLNMWQSGSSPHDLRPIINGYNIPALFEWLLRPNQPHPSSCALDETLCTITTQQPIFIASVAPASVKDVFFNMLIALLDGKMGDMSPTSVRAGNPWLETAPAIRNHVETLARLSHILSQWCHNENGSHSPIQVTLIELLQKSLVTFPAAIGHALADVINAQTSDELRAAIVGMSGASILTINSCRYEPDDATLRTVYHSAKNSTDSDADGSDEERELEGIHEDTRQDPASEIIHEAHAYTHTDPIPSSYAHAFGNEFGIIEGEDEREPHLRVDDTKHEALVINSPAVFSYFLCLISLLPIPDPSSIQATLQMAISLNDFDAALMALYLLPNGLAQFFTSLVHYLPRQKAGPGVPTVRQPTIEWTVSAKQSDDYTDQIIEDSIQHIGAVFCPWKLKREPWQFVQLSVTRLLALRPKSIVRHSAHSVVTFAIHTIMGPADSHIPLTLDRLDGALQAPAYVFTFFSASNAKHDTDASTVKRIPKYGLRQDDVLTATVTHLKDDPEGEAGAGHSEIHFAGRVMGAAEANGTQIAELLQYAYSANAVQELAQANDPTGDVKALGTEPSLQGAFFTYRTICLAVPNTSSLLNGLDAKSLLVAKPQHVSKFASNSLMTNVLNMIQGDQKHDHTKLKEALQRTSLPFRRLWPSSPVKLLYGNFSTVDPLFSEALLIMIIMAYAPFFAPALFNLDQAGSMSKRAEMTSLRNDLTTLKADICSLKGSNSWIRTTADSLPLELLEDLIDETLSTIQPPSTVTNWFVGQYTKFSKELTPFFSRFPDKCIDMSASSSRSQILSMLTGVRTGNRIRIFGPAGSGKTYVLSMIGLLYTALIFLKNTRQPLQSTSAKLVVMATANSPLTAFSKLLTDKIMLRPEDRPLGPLSPKAPRTISDSIVHVIADAQLDGVRGEGGDDTSGLCPIVASPSFDPRKILVVAQEDMGGQSRLITLITTTDTFHHAVHKLAAHKARVIFLDEAQKPDITQAIIVEKFTSAEPGILPVSVLIGDPSQDLPQIPNLLRRFSPDHARRSIRAQKAQATMSAAAAFPVGTTCLSFAPPATNTKENEAEYLATCEQICRTCFDPFLMEGGMQTNAASLLQLVCTFANDSATAPDAALSKPTLTFFDDDEIAALVQLLQETNGLKLCNELSRFLCQSAKHMIDAPTKIMNVGYRIHTAVLHLRYTPGQPTTVSQQVLMQGVLSLFHAIEKSIGLFVLHHPEILIAQLCTTMPFRSRRYETLGKRGNMHALAYNMRADELSALFIRPIIYGFCKALDEVEPFPNSPIASLLPCLNEHSGMRFFHVPKHGNVPESASHNEDDALGPNLAQQAIIHQWLLALTKTDNVFPTIGTLTTNATFFPAIIFTQDPSLAAYSEEHNQYLKRYKCALNNAAKQIIANPCTCKTCNSSTPNHNTLAHLTQTLRQSSPDGKRKYVGAPTYGGSDSSQLTPTQTLFALMQQRLFTAKGAIGLTMGAVCNCMSGGVTDPYSATVMMTRARNGSVTFIDALLAVSPYDKCFSYISAQFKHFRTYARKQTRNAPLAAAMKKAIYEIANVLWLHESSDEPPADAITLAENLCQHFATCVVDNLAHTAKIDSRPVFPSVQETPKYPVVSPMAALAWLTSSLFFPAPGAKLDANDLMATFRKPSAPNLRADLISKIMETPIMRRNHGFHNPASGEILWQS